MGFIDIKNKTDNSADIYFYGDIVSSWWGAWDDTDQYPENIKNILDDVKGKSLNIYVNSGGGSVFAGMAIYNMLKRHKGFKTVYVDGLAASIASVIALAGDKIIIPSNAFFMVHKSWSIVSGNADEFRKMADSLDSIDEGILSVYKDHLKPGISIQTIKDMVEKETWLNGEEASQYFNIEVGQANNAAACVSDNFRNFKNPPESIIKAMEKPKTPEPEEENSDHQNNENLELLKAKLKLKVRNM